MQCKGALSVRKNLNCYKLTTGLNAVSTDNIIVKYNH